jgi:hypothetical protein
MLSLALFRLHLLHPSANMDLFRADLFVFSSSSSEQRQRQQQISSRRESDEAKSFFFSIKPSRSLSLSFFLWYGNVMTLCMSFYRKQNSSNTLHRSWCTMLCIPDTTAIAINLFLLRECMKFLLYESSLARERER